MTVESKGHQPQLPGDEIENIARSPRVASRGIIETRVARCVYELNTGADLKINGDDFPTEGHRADWQKHTDSQSSMGD